MGGGRNPRPGTPRLIQQLVTVSCQPWPLPALLSRARSLVTGQRGGKKYMQEMTGQWISGTRNSDFWAPALPSFCLHGWMERAESFKSLCMRSLQGKSLRLAPSSALWSRPHGYPILKEKLFIDVWLRWSSLLHGLFSSCGKCVCVGGVLSSRSARASHCDGFSLAAEGSWGSAVAAWGLSSHSPQALGAEA